VSAISFHAYPYVQENYTLMGCGGSVGEGYGPMIVSSRKLELSDLRQHQDRCSGGADYGISGAEDLQSKFEDGDGAVRQDHSGDSERDV
jgi:hypothetical protein